jgi:hypothetical protein
VGIGCPLRRPDLLVPPQQTRTQLLQESNGQELSLRELEALAGAGLSGLLPFLHARITC